MKQKLMELGIDEAIVGKIENILKDEITDKYIPKSRFDEVNDAKKKAEADVASRDAQLEELKNATGDVDKLKKQIENLQADNQKAKEEYDAKLKAIRRDDFVKTTLREAGLLDDKYIPGVSAYLSIDKLDIDSVASVDAFKAELAEAKTITSSWFKSNEPPTKEINGFKINDPDNKIDPGSGTVDKDSYEYYLNKYTS